MMRLGNYQTTAELGGGAFGRVYLGTHTILTQRIVAIKVMRATCLGSQKAQDSFLREAHLLDVLRHPHILPILDVGFYEKLPYIVMEYAPNGSLKDRLLQFPGHALSEVEALTILVQIGHALYYVHQHHVIHRDLKPANILFGTNGEVLLADFGIATMLETATTVYDDPTGTPAYMAPEQFQGVMSRKSDQYALGCIAYELFTGWRPFTAPDFISLGFKHIKEQPIPPTFYNPHLSRHIEQAILKAMAKQRHDRYASIAAFISSLLGFTIPM